MALGFQGGGGADSIYFGNLGSFDPDGSTWAGWFYINATSNNDVLMAKHDNGTPWDGMQLQIADTAGDPKTLKFNWTGTTSLRYDAVDNSLPTLPAWVFLAVSIDSTAGNDNRITMYLGELGTPAALLSLELSDEGSTPDDCSAKSFKIGNWADTGGDSEIDGDVACVGVFPSILSLEDIIWLQFRPDAWGLYSPVLWALPGYNGTTDCPDFSGNGYTGTLTGNVTLEPHVPFSLNAPPPFYSFAAGAAAQTIAIGLITETDSVLALSAKKTKTLGLAASTDAALALSTTQVVALGLLTETDTLQPFARLKTKAMGLTTSSATAQTLTAIKSQVLGLLTEADLAQLLSSHKTTAIGQVVEADLAQAMTGQKVKAIGQPSEVDLAQAVTIPQPASPETLYQLVGALRW